MARSYIAEEDLVHLDRLKEMGVERNMLRAKLKKVRGALTLQDMDNYLKEASFLSTVAGSC